MIALIFITKKTKKKTKKKIKNANREHLRRRRERIIYSTKLKPCNVAESETISPSADTPSTSQPIS